MNQSNTQHTNTITLQDSINLRYLCKITGIRLLTLDHGEIRKLVPDQQKVPWENISMGQLGFDALEVRIKVNKIYYVVDMKEYHPEHAMQEHTDEISNEPVAKHYQYLFGTLVKVFSLEWLVGKVAEEMTRRYDALSGGQAQAVIKKFVPATREDGETMSSTTRTQIHRLREKIGKYKKLVDTFDLLLNDGGSLEELASTIKTSTNLGQGPYFIGERGMVGGDVINSSMLNVVSEVVQARKLDQSPEEIRSAAKAEEIEEVRQKLMEQGYNPDAEEESKETEEMDALYFLCVWSNCYHKEEFETDEDGKIIQKYHHDHPMALKLPRKDSDY